MNCPVCDAPLRAVQKYNVEVDICPGCKGVWLDRGELEKILELEASGGPVRAEAPAREYARPAEEPRYAPRRDHDDDDHDRDRDRHDSRDRRPAYDAQGRPLRQKSRQSWLGDLLGGIGGGDD